LNILKAPTVSRTASRAEKLKNRSWFNFSYSPARLIGFLSKLFLVLCCFHDLIFPLSEKGKS
jgi:hypothetical protein